MASLSETEVKQRINAQILKIYLGPSQDIDEPSSNDFCTYFETTYGAKKDTLKAKFLNIEDTICRATAWVQQHVVDFVAPSIPDDVPEFYVAPWQLGFTENHSVKGKSKLVHILDIVKGFLRRPYNSKVEPLQVLFAPR